jgi:putative membrane protein
MIKNFSDHSANERTYLAWIRTAIAVMAFGFVIEKFQLFLFSLAQEIGKPLPPAAGSHEARLLGMGLVTLGMGMMIVATVRFLYLKRQIDDTARQTVASTRAEVLLTLLLSLLGLFLLLYLSHLMV